MFIPKLRLENKKVFKNWHSGIFFVPEGGMKIARQFIAGITADANLSRQLQTFSRQ